MLKKSNGRGLVLSRFVGEEIYIDLPDGERITITTVRVRDTKVRLQISAPDTARILRSELVHKEAKPAA